MRNSVVCARRVVAKEGVREIPIKAASVAGEVMGGAFESTLERDLILLQVWDGAIDWFQTQPVEIPYVDAFGKSRSYTPDLLVSYDPRFARGRKPMLCEVKPRAVLLKDQDQLMPKFRAARAYCREQGWKFKIFDEARIRTPYLYNVQLLWRYRNSSSHRNVEEVVEALRPYDKVTLHVAVDNHFTSAPARGEAIWTFWVLVAHQHILFDMNKAINRDTLFWLAPWRRDAYFGSKRMR